MNEREKSLLLDNGDLPYTLTLTEPRLVRVMDEVDGGRWRFAASWLDTRLVMATDPGVDLAGDFNVRVWTLSGQYNGERLSLTTEYAAYLNRIDLSYLGTRVLDFSTHADGAYLQADYRLDAAWSLLGRVDATFLDRHNRGGHECTEGGTPVAQGGVPADRHRCFGLDTTAGLRWISGAHWGAWAEVHVVDGSANVQPRESNPAPEPHWSLLLFMAAYRF
jgi:hypothetical protein